MQQKWVGHTFMDKTREEVKNMAAVAENPPIPRQVKKSEKSGK